MCRIGRRTRLIERCIRSNDVPDRSGDAQRMFLRSRHDSSAKGVRKPLLPWSVVVVVVKGVLDYSATISNVAGESESDDLIVLTNERTRNRDQHS